MTEHNKYTSADLGFPRNRIRKDKVEINLIFVINAVGLINCSDAMVESGAGLAQPRVVRIFLLICLFLHYSDHKQIKDKLYTNGWAIQVSEPGGYSKALQIAKKHGFAKVEKVSRLFMIYYRLSSVKY